MAVTYTRLLGRNGVPIAQNLRLNVVRADITSYTTGGEAFAAKDAGLSKVHSVFSLSSEFAFLLRWDRTNGKLMLFGQTPTSATVGTIALDQIAAAADGGTHDLLVIGR